MVGPMGGPSRYPLAALRALRERVVRERQRQVAEARAALTTIEAQVAACGRAAMAAIEKLAEQRQRRMREAGRNIAALQTALDYEKRLERELAQADRQRDDAQAMQRTQQAAWQDAQILLQRAQQDEKLVAKHHARWTERQRAEAQRRAELEIEDLMTVHGTARRRPS